MSYTRGAADGAAPTGHRFPPQPPVFAGQFVVHRATGSRVDRAGSDRAGLQTTSSTRRSIEEMITRVVRQRERVVRHVQRADLVRQHTDITTQVERAVDAAWSAARATTAKPTAHSASRAAGGYHAGHLDSPPPIPIEQLTDQVVSKLDERLAAHRERFGQAF